ncbi:hypothetical protein BV22DRAFT_1040016 [Leucogyrophana mollusca]|uniref:Uncharacterized protein n=1 Tax=Leucogyrophana mollusca TaxID=85980 RepID=A0ACB8B4D1_9AGAM|nr:hypothetical protein BV22DRAFT_1040016 [Leucogyrophana mollusca]
MALVAEVGALLGGSTDRTIGALFATFFTAWSTALCSPAPSTPSLGAHTSARSCALSFPLLNQNSLSTHVPKSTPRARMSRSHNTHGMSARRMWAGERRGRRTA